MVVNNIFRAVKGVRNSTGTSLHSLVVVVRGMSSVAKSLVVFVLGGPGAGKGTQCERIVKVRSMVKYLGRPPLSPPNVAFSSSCSKHLMYMYIIFVYMYETALGYLEPLNPNN